MGALEWIIILVPSATVGFLCGFYLGPIGVLVGGLFGAVWGLFVATTVIR